ncbi:MAG: TonB-dependent receptor [Myxococcales bacterium]
MVRAQDDAGVRGDEGWVDAGPAAESDEGERSGPQPPRAVYIAGALWPADVPFPEQEFVEVGIVVGRDGRAQLEPCELPGAACDAIAAALVESEFLPAQVDGRASPARVRVRFPLLRAPTSQAPVGTAPAPSTTSPTTTAETPALPAAPAAPEYGAQGTVSRPNPTAHGLSLEQVRETPGAFGDPFRAIEALPGVVPVMSGVPYVYVRGAPPSATAYFYDDIQMPALFHMALGPAVVHPAMVGPIDFYPGVAPLRYGRKTGGVVAGKAAFRPLKPGVHGELEIRLVDMQAYLAKPFGKRGRIEIGGRYGYPGLVAMLFDSRARVQYWDYQLRAVLPLSATTEAQLVALGSYDFVGQHYEGRTHRDLELQFHRLDARLVKRVDELEIGTAVTGGIEHSIMSEEFAVRAYRMGSKLWLALPISKARLRLGADTLATSGRIQNPLANNDDPDQQMLQKRNPLYQSATGRNVLGGYVELRMPILPRLEFEGGLRGDIWLTGSKMQRALEPRGVVRWFATDALTVHAAAGLAYQPAVFLIPLPGISDVALDRGLQRAVQTEVGAGLDLPGSFRIESKLFAHFYSEMITFDTAIKGSNCTTSSDSQGVPVPAPAPPAQGQALEVPPEQPPPVQPPETCRESDGLARMSARAYGNELMIRRDYEEKLSGWLAYTLSKADGHTEDGKRLVPNFDVRHVANLVLRWRASPRWSVSLRGYAQSGRFPLGATTEIDPRQRARLPPFFRGDLNISRVWAKPWGELRFTLDWLNFTFQREPLSWSCNESRCKVEYVGFPITMPIMGVRGTF